MFRKKSAVLMLIDEAEQRRLRQWAIEAALRNVPGGIESGFVIKAADAYEKFVTRKK